jgi:hypothetical protein
MKTILKYTAALIAGAICFATLTQFIAYFEVAKTFIASSVLVMFMATVFIFLFKWAGIYNTFTEDKDVNLSPWEIIANAAIIVVIILALSIIMGAILCGAFLGV